MALTAPDILKSALVSYVLRGLTVATAFLAARGLGADDIWTPANLATLAGALATFLIDAFVTLYRKAKAHNLIEAAKEAPADTQMSVIQAAADQKPVIGN